MAKVYPLTMGVDQESPSMVEEETLVADLQATIEHYLPEFAKGVEAAAALVGEDTKTLLHQDGFAAAYHYDEYTLLGMAIKYAGLKGVVVVVIGKNHDTF